MYDMRLDLFYKVLWDFIYVFWISFIGKGYLYDVDGLG